MKGLKRIICGLSALTVLSMPITVNADTIKVPSVTIGTSIKVSYEGECGDNLTYSFNKDTGVLTISGTGDMYDFGHYAKQPWNGYQKEIKKIVIEDGVTSIGDHAFCTLTNLKDISIAESVTSIGDIAFSNIGLSEIYIPSKVNNLQHSIFESNKTLKIVISEESPYYTTVDDVIYTKDMSTLVIYPEWKEDKSFTVPNGVTTLENQCFFNNNYLEELILPDTVTDIGNSSISFCSNIKNLVLSKNLKTIGQGNFTSMRNLPVIVIPEGVTSIGLMTLFGCSYQMVIQLPSTLTDIGDHCFYVNPNKNEHFTIVAPENSYAWQYAQNNNVQVTDSIDNVKIYEFGDINADEKIDYLDVLLIKKYLLGINDTISILADINKDGKFNIVDLLQIKANTVK